MSPFGLDDGCPVFVSTTDEQRLQGKSKTTEPQQNTEYSDIVHTDLILLDIEVYFSKGILISNCWCISTV